jgi:hypothetical protein
MIGNMGTRAADLPPSIEGRSRNGSKVAEKRKAAEFLRRRMKDRDYFPGFDSHIEMMLSDRSVTPNRGIITKEVR